MKPKRTARYWARHQQWKCLCMGYHFPHRRTGGACLHGNKSAYYLALRAGVDRGEALALLSAAALESLP